MRAIAKLFSLVLLAVGPAQVCLAQESGFRDLTLAWRAPDDHIPSPPIETCPSVNSTVSGGAQSTDQPTPGPKSLQLTITQIIPSELHIGADFTATVRLKNIGTAGVLIPWQPDGEKVVRISQDGTKEMYEVADVSFRLRTGDKKRAPLIVQSEGALFAHPADPASYLDLAPGGWLEVKLKGTVACGLSECPVEPEADDHAVLTAWWYQRVLTHRVQGCNEEHGSSAVREVDSAPFPVAVRPASTPSSGPTEQPAQRYKLLSIHSPPMADVHH
jgi:hypothetical protein